jgi:hypothetical protein
MRASGWIGRVTAAAVLLAVSGTSGCKSLNERYIALEVWKYERCFGHLPPGFVPPGAAAAQAAPPRVCGQAAGCQDGCPPAAMSGCNDCAGGGMVSGGMVDGGMPVGGMSVGGMSAAPAMAAPAGPGGAPAGITAGKPVVISDELVVP